MKIKNILLSLSLLLLLLVSCEKEAYYHFDGWVESNGMIRISYCTDEPGFTLLAGCNREDVEDGGTPLSERHNMSLGYGEYSYTRVCTPMYFRIISPVADEIIEL